MKRIILSIVLVLGLSSVMPLAAQSRFERRSGDRRGTSLEMKLTEDQLKKMKDIDADFKKKIDQTNDSKLTAKERKEQMDKLRKEQIEAKKNVLTPEQQKTFANKDRRRVDGDRGFNDRRDRGDFKRGQGWYRGNYGPNKRAGGCCDGSGFMGRGMQGGCPYLIGDLDLTDAQKEKIQKLWNENEKDRNQMRTKHRDEMKKILTPEQLKKFEERWNR